MRTGLAACHGVLLLGLMLVMGSATGCTNESERPRPNVIIITPLNAAPFLDEVE
jgi:hypothetical protein